MPAQAKHRAHQQLPGYRATTPPEYRRFTAAKETGNPLPVQFVITAKHEAAGAELPRSGLFGVHQHEQNSTGLGPVIDPGMVRGLLDDRIARLEMDCRIIEHHVDLARQHPRVIDAAGEMHQRMGYGKSPCRCNSAARLDL